MQRKHDYTLLKIQMKANLGHIGEQPFWPTFAKRAR